MLFRNVIGDLLLMIHSNKHINPLLVFRYSLKPRAPRHLTVLVSAQVRDHRSQSQPHHLQLPSPSAFAGDGAGDTFLLAEP